MYLLFKRDIYRPSAGWTKYFVQLSVANCAMALLLIFLSSRLAQWLAWSTIERVWHLLVLLIAAIFVYLLVLFITGIRWRQLGGKGHAIS